MPDLPPKHYHHKLHERTSVKHALQIIGNVLWVVLGGLPLFLEYVIAGLLLCLTIVGIPFAIQIFKLGLLALWPFGRKVISSYSGVGDVSILMNVLWFILGGFWISLTHLVLMVALSLTIVGLPFAVQHWKLAVLALFPFGKEVVNEGEYDYV